MAGIEGGRYSPPQRKEAPFGAGSQGGNSFDEAFVSTAQRLGIRQDAWNYRNIVESIGLINTAENLQTRIQTLTNRYAQERQVPSTTTNIASGEQAFPLTERLQLAQRYERATRFLRTYGIVVEGQVQGGVVNQTRLTQELAPILHTYGGLYIAEGYYKNSEGFNERLAQHLETYEAKTVAREPIPLTELALVPMYRETKEGKHFRPKHYEPQGPLADRPETQELVSVINSFEALYLRGINFVSDSSNKETNRLRQAGFELLRTARNTLWHGVNGENRTTGDFINDIQCTLDYFEKHVEVPDHERNTNVPLKMEEWKNQENNR